MAFVLFQNGRREIAEIPLDDPFYPSEWLGLPTPPKRLYAVGDTSLLKERKFAVVGSRRTPANAMKVGGEIARALSERFVLVTGVADGGDTAAIEGALKGSGRVICLLAGGFSALPQGNIRLLERVAERGLLLAYQPYETSVRSFSYELRNKLLSLLAEGLLVLGAGEKSGALITAKYAMAGELPVFALPYPPNAASGTGCNGLIKKGAHLVEGAEDILLTYGFEEVQTKEKIPLTADEERVYTALKEAGTAHGNDVARAANIPPFKVRAILSALEVKGLAVAVGGNRFSIV